MTYELHTLTFSKLAREVVAFEPNPSLVPNLRRTVANLVAAKTDDASFVGLFNLP